MRPATRNWLLAVLALCLTGRAWAADLEQVISHENPLFQPEAARLTVGRDGRVYLAHWGKSNRIFGIVLHMSREGKEKFTAEVPFSDNATANKDGVIALAAPAYGGYRVALYAADFRPLGGVDGFDPNIYSPVHVEAGPSGDFYALDPGKMQVVRLSSTGKRVKAYPLPDGLPRDKDKRTYRDFRVCEKTGAFYLLAHPLGVARIFCVGFDGKDRWSYDGGVPSPVTTDANRIVGAYDVDEDGVLYVLDGKTVKKVGPDGKLAGQIKLQMGDARPGPGRPNYAYLRVYRDELLLKRMHPSELFRRYDRKTGALRQTVHIDHERLSVSFAGDVWTAGRPVPVRIQLTSGERQLSPRWRVWARPFASLDYREFPLKDGAIQVPADCAGLYLVKVTPEVQPWQRGAVSDYLVRAVIEVRQPGTSGSATVLTPGNRTHYGRGEEIPFTVAVRGTEADRSVALTVSLIDGGRTLARERAEVKGEQLLRFRVSKGLTARLRPGRYTLAVAGAGLACSGQPLIIGPGLRKSAFHIVQHGDYNQLYPATDVWDAPDLTAAHAARTAKLGVNLMVDRLGHGAQLWNLSWSKMLHQQVKNRAELDALAKRLGAVRGGLPPGRASMAVPLLQTQAAYGALGIEQMASLVSMDAGLPLGNQYDQRSRADFARDLTLVTEALLPYPSFRGWMWAANWWVWEERPGNDPRGPRRAKEAKTPAEKAAYLAALQQAEKTGAWDPVLGKVADHRLGYAVEAQDFFNRTLKKIAPGKITAVSGPYRGLDVYPPTTFGNVDEVDLHYQAEQLQWPHVAAHNVDYQKRPGKRAWGHPEVGNDAGTGDQVLPALFQMVMRGSDGVGCSGPIPNWGPQPADPRSAYQGTTSVHRAVYRLLRQYGPWLTTLRNNDRVAILVSGRMARIDDWGAIGGRYFDRLFEAYQSCLRAHYPASFVFVEDLTPDLLKRYKAVLVVGQTVELEPVLVEALKRARTAGTKVFHDATCRAELVKDSTPLGIAFDKIGKDPSAWQDDTAYLRFPGYYRAHLPALTKALAGVLPPVAEVNGPEVLLSERAAEEGRYLFVVNDTVPDLDPGQLWRVTLAIATRVPLTVPVKLHAGGEAVYDVFALTRVNTRDGRVQADLRCLPCRLFAVLPAAIGRVELRGPKKARAGQAFGWSASVQDGDGKAIRASIPMRIRLLDRAGRVLDELFTASGSKGAAGTLRTLLNAAPGAQTLEATELFSGQTARLPTTIEAPAGPARLTGEEKQPDVSADTVARSTGAGTGLAAEELFGPHVRDLVLAERGTLAVASTMNWDHNLYAVDVKTGALRWRQRAGHYFAFAPQALSSGLAVQGYDLKSAEGYHLYLAGDDGKLERRFALYGLPKRLPHRFLPGLFLSDHVNNFAVPADGGWVASAGDLGLAVWSRAGKLLWSQDWWKERRRTAALAALDADTLLAVEGMTATAYAARTGRPRWQVRLARSGEASKATVCADGKTCAIQARDGGHLYIVRAGKVVATIQGGAVARNLRHLSTATADVALGITGVALSADGSLVAVTAGNLLKLYSVADGLRWILPADDTLQGPCFSADGKRLAAGSELGTLYVVSAEGSVLLERDLGALPVPAWLPDGDLLAGTWMGTLCRLDANYAERWRTRLRPAAPDMRGKLLAEASIPTARIAFRGNAAEKPAPLTPNLLGPKDAFIKLVWAGGDGKVQNWVTFAHDSTFLMDGKADAPASPWIGWAQMNWYAEGNPFTYLWIDTYRTRLRVTGITLAEDPAHPESWLRHATFEYWDAAAERWVFVQPLLSDAAVHTHKFARPVEAARFRIVLPKMFCGNLRLGEIVLHGEKLGPSHPDVVAKKPVAVLFDEGNDLVGFLHRTTFALKGAYSGSRCLTIGGEDAYSFAPWSEGSKVFGHTLPNWDFPIREEPRPGEYRYLQFAWKALAPGTKTVSFRLDGEPANTYTVTLYAGARPPGEPLHLRRVADKVPDKWTVVRVDLWDVFKKPVPIRGMQLAAPGGSAAFDQILLGRTEKDLPPLRK